MTTSRVRNTEQFNTSWPESNISHRLPHIEPNLNFVCYLLPIIIKTYIFLNLCPQNMNHSYHNFFKPHKFLVLSASRTQGGPNAAGKNSSMTTLVMKTTPGNGTQGWLKPITYNPVNSHSNGKYINSDFHGFSIAMLVYRSVGLQPKYASGK